MKFHCTLLAAATLVFSLTTGLAVEPERAPAAGGQLPRKVAAVGDSITAGAGTANRTTDSYPSQLAQMLGDQWEVKNFGVSGATLLKTGNRPYQDQPACQQAQDFNPDVVVIMLGTNDTKPQNWSSKGEFVSDYRDLIGKFKRLAAKPRIFICYPPFVVGKGAFGINENGVLEQVPMIAEIAREEQVAIIDVHGALNARPELSKDRVHPNFAGATVVAAKVYEALTGKPFTGPAPVPVPPPKSPAAPSAQP